MCVQLSSELCISRRRFIKTMKPLLPRKRSSSARINLNRHWNELEELYGETYRTRITHFETLLLHNELNDNAINEAREAAAAAAAATSVATPEDHPMPEDDLLTPPPTPFPGAQRTFDFTIVEDEDIADNEHDLPLTPASPEEAWDVFTFPQAPSSSATHLE